MKINYLKILLLTREMESKRKNQKHNTYTNNHKNQNNPGKYIKKIDLYNNNVKQKENKKNLENVIQIRNFTYYHKIPTIDGKKEKDKEKEKEHATVDSSSEIRLPSLYIDLSFDNPLNK